MIRVFVSNTIEPENINLINLCIHKLQSITNLCKRLDDLKEELTRASVEDQELFLSEINNAKKALDDDLTEVYT